MVPRKLLEVASHFREMPQNTACQMATDESDEGSHFQFHIWSFFPSFSFKCLREYKLSLILLLPHKIPIILSSFNKVLERQSQVKSTLFTKPQRPQRLVSH